MYCAHKGVIMNYDFIVNNFEDVRNDSFHLSCSMEKGLVFVKLKGKVDIPNPDEVLLPALLRLDRVLVESRAEEVAFNIEELDFINSSGIKVVLQLVMNILNRQESQQYKISFYHNPESKYQKKSFNAISFLAPTLISFVP